MTEPTLYEWAGGADALRKLFESFYGHVREDPTERGGHAHMTPSQ